MATTQTVTPVGNLHLCDKRHTDGVDTNPLSSTLKAAGLSHAAADSRLAAISNTTYTAAVIQSMTYNDKIYAIRLADDPTGI